MTNIEHLKKLAQNPFYVMSDAEKQELAKAESQESAMPAQEIANYPKVSSRGNAAVKETGKFEKHSTDPVAE